LEDALEASDVTDAEAVSVGAAVSKELRFSLLPRLLPFLGSILFNQFRPSDKILI
jgi:hypothetical protein